MSKSLKNDPFAFLAPRSTDPLGDARPPHGSLPSSSAGEEEGGPALARGIAPSSSPIYDPAPIRRRHWNLDQAMIQTAKQSKPNHRWAVASGDLWCPDCGQRYVDAEDFCNDHTLCESCRLRPAVIKWNDFDLCPSCVDEGGS